MLKWFYDTPIFRFRDVLILDMKLSLTLKLTLAFIFTSLTGIVLVEVIARYVTASEFDRLLRQRTNAEVLTFAKAYYQEKGSWDGFDVAITFWTYDPASHVLTFISEPVAPIAGAVVEVSYLRKP